MTPEERQRFWRDHMERWRESGLTQTAYCQRQGMSRWAFGRWKRRLEGTASRKKASLVPVRLRDDKPRRRPSGGETGVVVEVDEGLRLRLARGFDAAVLAEAVAALRRR